MGAWYLIVGGVGRCLIVGGGGRCLAVGGGRCMRAQDDSY